VADARALIGKTDRDFVPEELAERYRVDDLRVMDATAVALCRENGIPIVVFNILKKGNLTRVLEGKVLGTVVE
jgi:uridylate kinase